ncbi:trypsin-like serine peptidase [Actinoplanes sp. NPDC000266]
MRNGLGVRAGQETEIFLPDQRSLVTNTLRTPFRFVCCLGWEVADPHTGGRFLVRGSGTLIGERHVLTAAHNVLEDYSNRTPLPMRYIWSANMQVAPARNDRQLLGHASTVRRMRVSPLWRAAANRQTRNGNTQRVFGPAAGDFALLTLDAPLGSRFPPVVTMALPPPPLGWWGHPRFGGTTRIRAYDADVLRRLRRENVLVNHAGYPVDKCRDQPPRGSATPADLAACTGHIPDMPEWLDQGSTQWLSTGRLLDPARMTFDLDAARGQSGGPVWLNWEGHRNLVAVFTGGSPRDVAPFDIVANQGVRITEPILRQLRTWMRADRADPGF